MVSSQKYDVVAKCYKYLIDMNTSGFISDDEFQRVITVVHCLQYNPAKLVEFTKAVSRKLLVTKGNLPIVYLQ